MRTIKIVLFCISILTIGSACAALRKSMLEKRIAAGEYEKAIRLLETKMKPGSLTAVGLINLITTGWDRLTEAQKKKVITLKNKLPSLDKKAVEIVFKDITTKSIPTKPTPMKDEAEEVMVIEQPKLQQIVVEKVEVKPVQELSKQQAPEDEEEFLFDLDEVPTTGALYEEPKQPSEPQPQQFEVKFATPQQVPENFKSR